MTHDTSRPEDGREALLNAAHYATLTDDELEMVMRTYPSDVMAVIRALSAPTTPQPVAGGEVEALRAVAEAAGGWRPAEEAPNGCAALIRLKSGDLHIAYKTMNEPPFLQSWHYLFGPAQGQQAPWPADYVSLRAALARLDAPAPPAPVEPERGSVEEAARAAVMAWQLEDGYGDAEVMHEQMRRLQAALASGGRA